MSKDIYQGANLIREFYRSVDKTPQAFATHSKVYAIIYLNKDLVYQAAYPATEEYEATLTETAESGVYQLNIPKTETEKWAKDTHVSMELIFDLASSDRTRRRIEIGTVKESGHHPS